MQSYSLDLWVMSATAHCFLLCSCMKALNHPLLELQLKDPDNLLVSPLRDFATEILVFSYCSFQEKKNVTFDSNVW